MSSKTSCLFKSSNYETKKPNSAQRKVARVKLYNEIMLTGYITGQGHVLQRFSQVLVQGGRANDLPGVRYSFIRGKFD